MQPVLICYSVLSSFCASPVGPSSELASGSFLDVLRFSMAVGVYVELVASLLVSAFLGLKEKVQKCGEIREREEKTGPDFKDKRLDFYLSGLPTT